MKNMYLFIILFLIHLFTPNIKAIESMVRPVPIVPKATGLSTADSAYYSIISFLPNDFLLDQLSLILSHDVKYSSEKINNYSIKQLQLKEIVMQKLRKEIAVYRNKNGRLKTTYQEAKLYAISKIFGLKGYIEAQMQFIDTRKLIYDSSLARLSIDNNVPVVLINDNKVYLCLAYNDSSMVMVDMEKATGYINIPGEWYQEFIRLKNKKSLNKIEKKTLAGLQEIYDKGAFVKSYEIYYFCYENLDNFYNHNHIIIIPHEKIKGEMVLFASPKLEVDKLIKR